MTELTRAERETLENLPTGLFVNSGRPCECGAEAYNTSKSREYSDSMLYTHNCTECGNEFTTFTEG